MNWNKQLNITDGLIEKLKCFSTIKTYTQSAPLFYEGQIPIVAFLVLRGSIHLSKKKRLQNVLRAGSIIGAEEVLHLEPCDVSAEVTSDTTLCFLDRTTLIELDKGHLNELNDLLVQNLKESS